MLMGSQRFQRPVSPSKSIQQLVARNGGSASAAIEPMRKSPRARLETPLNQRAVRKPPTTQAKVAAALTIRLLKTSGQFI